MTRPRVLVLLKGLFRGGAEALVLDQTRWWNTLDFEYHVGYLDPRIDQLASDFSEAGFPPIAAGTHSANRNILLGRAHALIGMLEPDLVHAHLPLPGLVARTSRTPAAIVYTEHNLPSSYHPLTRRLNSLTYSRNDAVICVSEAVHDAVSEKHVSLLQTIQNAVTVPAAARSRETVRAEFGLDADTRLILHVGHIRPGKGHENLLESVTLLKNIEIPFKVVSIGAEQVHGMRRELRNKADARGVASLINFIGERSDAHDLINAADVIVSPSEVEGLPIALLEAMALAKPIAATAAGGVGALIEDGVRGRVVDPRSPHQLADAIEMLLRDSETGSRMAVAAKMYLQEHHSARGAVERIEDIYRQVLAMKRRT